MVSTTKSLEELNTLKVELIHVNLETAATFAKLSLESDDEKEVVRTRQKACVSYEEALHLLRTAVLSQIEFESIRTKTAHLDSLLMASGKTL